VKEKKKKTFAGYATPPIPALLVGKNVRAQAPFSNTNTNNNKNLKTQSEKKSSAFDIKQQRVVFLELSCKERKKNVVYVDGGRVMAIVNI
jgi:hypothetical protein